MKTREVVTMLLAIFWMITAFTTIISSEVEKLESESIQHETCIHTEAP